MKFGEMPIAEALGVTLAHGLPVGGRKFKKGRVLAAEDIDALRVAEITHVVAARLDRDDVREDAAAQQIAEAATGAHLTATAAFTGRVNLYADARGLAVYDRNLLNEINRIDQAITIAALPAFAPVEPRQMVATIKIIPFAVHEQALELCVDTIAKAGGLFRVAPFQARGVGLIQTTLSGTLDKVLDKTGEVVRARIEALGGALIGETRCAHNAADVASDIRAWRKQGRDMLLISGASAITDRRDVVPAAIEAAGGAVEHIGMPVDPGNLLLLGRDGDAPVLGLPGCARSPKLNGFDWVLQRLAAGLAVTRDDIMDMGAGGLLTEIASRPLPRADAGPPVAPSHARRVAAIILAAGQSRRMGPINKLLAEIDGTPMVVRVADAVLASQAGPVIAVVGHEADRVRTAFAGRDIVFVENPDYADGISGSLRRGLRALPGDISGALICLGDMPRVTAAQIDRLIAAFNPVEGRAICVPTFNGKRGNPVLFARRFFEEMEAVSGDVGARHLIGEAPELVCEVAMEDRGVLVDIDTPEALAGVED